MLGWAVVFLNHRTLWQRSLDLAVSLQHQRASRNFCSLYSLCCS